MFAKSGRTVVEPGDMGYEDRLLLHKEKEGGEGRGRFKKRGYFAGLSKLAERCRVIKPGDRGEDEGRLLLRGVVALYIF
jgi:hypothetical protein